MVKAIRTISVERGSDPADFALFSFGDARPRHATEVARELGIGTIIVPSSPGILSAQGLLNSDLVADFVRAALLPIEGGSAFAFSQLRQSLAARAEAWFASEKIPSESGKIEIIHDDGRIEKLATKPASLKVPPSARRLDRDAGCRRFWATD
jgi:N-methylhydantoinase A